MTVLVLGLGGNVGQGILKSLTHSSLKVRVVGACINPFAMGLFTVDRAYVSPRFDDPGFIPWVLDICQREGVQAILCGVEPVVHQLSRHREEIQRRTGAICIVSSADALAVADDKLRTCEWLRDHGFAYPRFAACEEPQEVAALVAEVGFPLIAKPRSGKGSESIHLLPDRAALEAAQVRKGLVIQEYLGDEHSEYTVGCFIDKHGRSMGSIVMRRLLAQGTTVVAQIEERPEIGRTAETLALALQPTGPCNVQLRISRGVPVAFEFNVRFSGTTPIRVQFGYNEVEASLRHFVLGEELQPFCPADRGVALRYWNELYVDPDAYESMWRQGKLEDPGAFKRRLEVYGQ